MRRLFLVLALAALLMPAAQGQPPAAGDTLRAALARQVGQTVTLKLDSGEELTGLLRSVGDSAVSLQKLSGREFYDAVVDIEEVAALIYRTR